MLVGYFASAITIKMGEATLGINALPIGLLVGVAAGAIFSLLHAFASINLKADQVISGTAINMLAAALTVYLARTISGSGNVRIMMGIVRQNIPFLSKIPIIGPLFFSQSYWTTWVCLIIWALSWILLYKTSFGLRLRACGEHPSAVASAGISVHKMRYFGVAMSGALAGLGGSVILITYSGEFNGTVAGLGFLSIAALIFGQWKPLGILGATFFFWNCNNNCQCQSGYSFIAGHSSCLLQDFPVCSHLASIGAILEEFRCSKGKRRTVLIVSGGLHG